MLDFSLRFHFSERTTCQAPFPLYKSMQYLPQTHFAEDTYSRQSENSGVQVCMHSPAEHHRPDLIPRPASSTVYAIVKPHRFSRLFGSTLTTQSTRLTSSRSRLLYLNSSQSIKSNFLSVTPMLSKQIWRRPWPPAKNITVPWSLSKKISVRYSTSLNVYGNGLKSQWIWLRTKLLHTLG
jgi:hypothetical protein